MRRIAVAAVALSLLGGTSALAQPDQHHHDQNGGAGPSSSGPHGAPGGAPHGAPLGPGPHGAPNTGPSHGPAAPVGPAGQSFQHNAPAYTGSPTHGPAYTGGPNNGYNGHPNYNGYNGQPNTTGPTRNAGTYGQGPGGHHPAFGVPGYRPGGTRPHYSAQYFPHVYNPGQRFHWRGGWVNQPGYRYRSWAYGDYLPHGWFGSQWWINDYWLYDLAVPPFGYEWVRVGPDALLVDLDTGEVVEVVPALFF